MNDIRPKRTWLSCLSMLFIVFFIVACSNTEDVKGSGEAEGENEQHEDVAITVGVRYLTDEEVQQYIVDPVSEEYPWITVNIVNYDFDELPELILKKEVPDLFITNNVSGMPPFEESGLFTSIEALVNEHNVDLTRIEPEALETVKLSSGQDDLVGLPYTRKQTVMFYNKEIFDRFGINYPEDGMTWDEVTNLANDLTRESEGLQYRGLEPSKPEYLAGQLSLPFVDPETNQAAVNSDGWRTVFNQLKKIYEIPGNEETGGGIEQFLGEQRLAMYVDSAFLNEEYIENQTIWDSVTVPVWEENPEVGYGIDEHVMLLSTTSEHPDDAFRVMSLLVSDEVQKDMARNGKPSILLSDEVQKAYGENISAWEGKNSEAAVKTTPAQPYHPSLYDRESIDIIHEQFEKVINEGLDVNTALSQAEQAINNLILDAEGAS